MSRSVCSAVRSGCPPQPRQADDIERAPRLQTENAKAYLDGHLRSKEMPPCGGARQVADRDDKTELVSATAVREHIGSGRWGEERPDQREGSDEPVLRPESSTVSAVAFVASACKQEPANVLSNPAPL